MLCYSENNTEDLLIVDNNNYLINHAFSEIDTKPFAVDCIEDESIFHRGKTMCDQFYGLLPSQSTRDRVDTYRCLTLHPQDFCQISYIKRRIICPLTLLCWIEAKCNFELIDYFPDLILIFQCRYPPFFILKLQPCP